MNTVLVNSEWLNALASIGFWIPVNLIFYGFYHLLFCQISNRYRDLSYDRRFYIVKNISKSTMLVLLLLCSTPCIYQGLVWDNWDNNRVHLIGSVYVSTDVTGLLTVPNLATTTKLHHCCVLVLGMVNLLSDYGQEGLHRALISLTYFSMIPYVVNAYLAVRWLVNERPKRQLAFLSLFVYLFSVIFNFFIQHWYVLATKTRSNVELVVKGVYLLIYWVILNDDITLIQHLYRNGYQKRPQQQPDLVADTDASSDALVEEEDDVTKEASSDTDAVVAVMKVSSSRGSNAGAIRLGARRRRKRVSRLID